MGRQERCHLWATGVLSVMTLISGGCGSAGGGTGELAAITRGHADAGPDQSVLVGSSVMLDGRESVSGSTSLITYEWTLTEKPRGSAATLSDPTVVRPTFTADVAGTYTAKLVVTSEGTKSNPNTVNITASTGNVPPIAVAGTDRTVSLGTLVMGNGSGSYDPNGTSITYSWRFQNQPPKSQAVLLNPTSATPSFTPDVEGRYRLALTVSDGSLTSSPDRVDITVTTGNIAPVADAGLDQQVSTGQLVTLTGAGSRDANNDPLTYSWRFQSKPVGSTATLAEANTSSPTFTPDFAGFYVIALTVSDGQVNSAIDTIVIEARLPGFVNLRLQAYLKASNTGAGDFFAAGVALSGDTLAIGAQHEDSCATGVNGDQANNSCQSAGAVYIFTRTDAGWSQQAYIKASNAEAGDFFGGAVALSGDTLAVGAIGEDSCATGIDGDQLNNSCQSRTLFTAGAVYVFTRNNGIWSQQAYVKASNTDIGDYFGTSVALSGDTLVVGAAGEASCATGINGDQMNNSCGQVDPAAGAVYVFTRSGGVWSQQAYVKASNTGTGDRFGRALALDGDTLAVGAATEESCAAGINGDQTNNSCGASGDAGAGAVYIFTRANGVWSQQAYVKASNPEVFDSFGTSVTLSGDTLAVGAGGEASCATGINGDQGNNACFSAGAVYVFTRSNGTWSQQAYVKASNTGFADNFGSSVALSGDTLAVGAGREFSCATGVNGNQSDNGCDGAGAVYVFMRSHGTWAQQAYLKASNAEAHDGFAKVVLDGDTLAVGAGSESSCATGINGNQADNSCPAAGAVYVYVMQ
jgi:hypothetical protein